MHNQKIDGNSLMLRQNYSKHLTHMTEAINLKQYKHMSSHLFTVLMSKNWINKKAQFTSPFNTQLNGTGLWCVAKHRYPLIYEVL